MRNEKFKSYNEEIKGKTREELESELLDIKENVYKYAGNQVKEDTKDKAKQVFETVESGWDSVTDKAKELGGNVGQFVQKQSEKVDQFYLKAEKAAEKGAAKLEDAVLGVEVSFVNFMDEHKSKQDQKSLRKEEKYQEQQNQLAKSEYDAWWKEALQEKDLENKAILKAEKQETKEKNILLRKSKNLASKQVKSFIKGIEKEKNGPSFIDKTKEKGLSLFQKAKNKINSVSKSAMDMATKGKKLVKDVIKASPDAKALKAKQQTLEKQMKIKLLLEEKAMGKIQKNHGKALSDNELNDIMLEARSQELFGEAPKLTQEQSTSVEKSAQKEATKEARKEALNECKKAFSRITEKTKELVQTKEKTQQKDKGLEM